MNFWPIFGPEKGDEGCLLFCREHTPDAPPPKAVSTFLQFPPSILLTSLPAYPTANRTNPRLRKLIRTIEINDNV